MKATISNPEKSYEHRTRRIGEVTIRECVINSRGDLEELDGGYSLNIYR